MRREPRTLRLTESYLVGDLQVHVTELLGLDPDARREAARRLGRGQADLLYTVAEVVDEGGQVITTDWRLIEAVVTVGRVVEADGPTGGPGARTVVERRLPLGGGR